jgi:hypothetical protein
MKLQFSLATLLVCMTVLAVVAAICALVKVHQDAVIDENHVGQTATFDEVSPEIIRLPNGTEFASRIFLWGPISVAVPLTALWTIRRLKSGRWFRLSTRDLLWLVALCAMGLGWFLDRQFSTNYRYTFSTEPDGSTMLHDNKTRLSWHRTKENPNDWYVLPPYVGP